MRETVQVKLQGCISSFLMAISCLHRTYDHWELRVLLASLLLIHFTVLPVKADIYPGAVTVQVYSVVGTVTSIPMASIEAAATNTGASCAGFMGLLTNPHPIYGNPSWVIGSQSIEYTVTNTPAVVPGGVDQLWYVLEDCCDVSPDKYGFITIQYVSNISRRVDACCDVDAMTTEQIHSDIGLLHTSLRSVPFVVEERGTNFMTYTNAYQNPDPGYTNVMILVTTDSHAGGRVSLLADSFSYEAPKCNFPYCCSEGYDDFLFSVRSYNLLGSLVGIANAIVAVTVTDKHYEPGLQITTNVVNAGTFTEMETATLSASNLRSTNVVTTINCPDDLYICAVENPTPLGGETYIVPDSGGDIRYTSPDDVPGTVTDLFSYVICDSRGGSATQYIKAVIYNQPRVPDTCASLYTVETNVCEVNGTVVVPAEDLLAAIDCPCDTRCITGVAAVSLSYGNFYVTKYDPACTNDCCISAVTYVASPMNIVGIGTDYFEYYGTDCSNNYFTGTLQIRVAPVVDPSEVIATNVVAETEQETELHLSVTNILAGCSGYDVLEPALEAFDSISTQGGFVSLVYTNSGQGEFVYTPPHGFRGFDSFSYQVTDGTLVFCGGDFNMATGAITITVNPNLASPIAYNDEYHVVMGTMLSVFREEGVISNDWSYLIDLTGFPPVFAWDVMGVTSYSDPSHGSVFVDTSGAFAYAPDMGYSGNDEFTYQVCDSNGLYSGEAVVRILVISTQLYSLTINTYGAGAVSNDPPGTTFNSLDVVTLYASPSNYWYFNNWSNDASGVSQITNIVITNNMTANACFNPYEVTNGVPVWWLADHGCGTNDGDAMADSDGDQALNWEEWYAGTDPTNILSVFKFEQVNSSSNQPGTLIKWSSVSNKTYSLSLSTNLVQGFTELETNIAAMPPENTYHDTLIDAEMKSYRIGVNK